VEAGKALAAEIVLWMDMCGDEVELAAGCDLLDIGQDDATVSFAQVCMDDQCATGTDDDAYVGDTGEVSLSGMA
jgi:hypothetical protein